MQDLLLQLIVLLLLTGAARYLSSVARCQSPLVTYGVWLWFALLIGSGVTLIATPIHANWFGLLLILSPAAGISIGKAWPWRNANNLATGASYAAGLSLCCILVWLMHDTAIQAVDYAINPSNEWAALFSLLLAASAIVLCVLADFNEDGQYRALVGAAVLLTVCCPYIGYLLGTVFGADWGTPAHLTGGYSVVAGGGLIWSALAVSTSRQVKSRVVMVLAGLAGCSSLVVLFSALRLIWATPEQLPVLVLLPFGMAVLSGIMLITAFLFLWRRMGQPG